MPKVLLIDDDPHLRKILSRVLQKNDFEVIIAEDGATGLRVARRQQPDLIILDIIMPGMDGFEVAQRLHNDPTCARIPIMVLTAYATPWGRKTAVEVGVDDFVTKPFGIDDVVAKVKAMTSPPELSPDHVTAPLKTAGRARTIAVHSLRGGLGSTSLAINLATALKNVWSWPALLLDADFTGGQVAMALNWPAGLSWSDLIHASLENSVHRLLDDERIEHDDGLHVVIAPADLRDAERITPRLISQCLNMLGQRYDYIVADLAHDLRQNTLEMLKNADQILYLLAVDAISLQLTRKALAAYQAQGIPAEKVALVLANPRPGKMAMVGDIELAVGRPLAATIPYSADMIEAIDRGLAFVDFRPVHKVTRVVEDLAFLLSKAAHRNTRPSSPTPAYNRVSARVPAAARNGSTFDIGRIMMKQVDIDQSRSPS
jgi:pilus assembly protein CpaE